MNTIYKSATFDGSIVVVFFNTAFKGDLYTERVNKIFNNN